MVSWAPGENAMTILAIGNGKKYATMAMKNAATAIDTANEPSAAPR